MDRWIDVYFPFSQFINNTFIITENGRLPEKHMVLIGLVTCEVVLTSKYYSKLRKKIIENEL